MDRINELPDSVLVKILKVNFSLSNQVNLAVIERYKPLLCAYINSRVQDAFCAQTIINQLLTQDIKQLGSLNFFNASISVFYYIAARIRLISVLKMMTSDSKVFIDSYLFKDLNYYRDPAGYIEQMSGLIIPELLRDPPFWNEYMQVCLPLGLYDLYFDSSLSSPGISQFDIYRQQVSQLKEQIAGSIALVHKSKFQIKM